MTYLAIVAIITVFYAIILIELNALNKRIESRSIFKSCPFQSFIRNLIIGCNISYVITLFFWMGGQIRFNYVFAGVLLLILVIEIVATKTNIRENVKSYYIAPVLVTMLFYFLVLKI